METLGTLFEGDWSSFGSVYLYQEADFNTHLEPDEDSIFSVRPTLCPSHKSAVNLSETEERAFCSFDAIYHNSHWYSSVNIDDCIAISFFANSGYSNYFENLAMESQSISNEICDADAGNSSYLIDVNNSPQLVITEGDESHRDLKDTWLYRGSDDSGETVAAQSKKCSSSAMSRKRWQNTEDGNVRNVRRKNQKSHLPGKNNEESHALTHGQAGVGLSEGDASSPQGPSGNLPNISSRNPAALSLTGKTRATRGSATDPQSLYARKRRERINERLRILQKLVPNGTKVDISTMLEEAVHYVKFLQLQIRMLSSDDLWMYAPISYNGMNIGFDWQTFMSRRQ